VLETQATVQQKTKRLHDEEEVTEGEKGGEATPIALTPAIIAQPDQMALWQKTKKPRPVSLRGYTYSISTPLGKAFVTINENGEDQPFEVFVNTAKAGSDTAAVSEAIGRLISYLLRLASPIPPLERLKEVRRQLSGIGGGRSLGFGPNRVRSLPDGVSQALNQYLEKNVEKKTEPDDGDQVGDNGNGRTDKPEAESQSAQEVPAEHLSVTFGDLCPDCGHASVVNEEGCRKCYACGFSEC
jgi:ribonucleoside-diphosphate reductase alpha chain